MVLLLFPAHLLAARSGWFAEGRFLGRLLDEWINDTQEFIRTKLPHLILLLVIAFILNYLLKLVTSRMVRLAERHSAVGTRLSQVRTLAGVVRTTGIAIIGVIVSMQFLAAVGVNLAPLLASAGVAGVAIGLAAQNIVKDVLNGVLILIEDQFDVGDTVRLAGLAGTVEAMTLRKTLVRDGDGTLYVIPNSQITTVANQSIGYSVATINVSVDGRAQLVDDFGAREPTATIRLDALQFTRLVGGRPMCPARVQDVELGGDKDVAAQIVDRLNFVI